MRSVRHMGRLLLGAVLFAGVLLVAGAAAAWAAAPTISSLSPTSGPSAGGTSVTITGSGLTGTTSVTFGGTEATAFTIDNDTQISATTPAGTAGTVDVVVTNPEGTATGSFTYVDAPDVTAISPAGGPPTGGTTVTITGTGLTGATSVKFGATDATWFNVDSATKIRATAPAGTGTVDIVVANPAGTDTLAAAYTYKTAPTITSLSPTYGSAGDTVTIKGYNLTGATAVKFGSVRSLNPTVVSDTEITASAPAQTADGAVLVTVTTAAGTSDGVRFVYGATSSPHGGFDTGTSFCRQCHSMHDAADATGRKALLWQPTVDAVCSTCHSAGSTDVPGVAYPGKTRGTVSKRAVYDTPDGPLGQHTIGATSIPGADDSTVYQWGWGKGSWSGGAPANNGGRQVSSGGLTCASCHTPHGTKGQLVNSKQFVQSKADDGTITRADWVEGAALTMYKPYLGLGSYGDVTRYLKGSGTSWELCEDAGLTTCTAANVKDVKGEWTPMFGYKLLSAFPNATTGSGAKAYQSFTAYKYVDSDLWCGSCHTNRVNADANTLHNHPSCTRCHNNPTGEDDYPHTTSNDWLLKQYPDALCTSCHNGSSDLP